jgi:hypothetical protein
VLPIFFTVLAGAALGGGIAAGLTVIVIAAVVALVVLGAINAVRSLDRLSHTLYD